MFNLIHKKMETLNFDKIYKEYKGQVINVIRMNVKSNEQIEEIANDVFIKVWEHLKEYDIEKAQFNTWLFHITKNKVIDYFRQSGIKSQRFVSVDNFTDANGEPINVGNFFSGTEEANHLVENNELAEETEKAFESLKPNYRMVAEMYLRQDRSYKEIAEILDIPMSNVKVTLMRAKEMLQKHLAKQRQLMFA